MGKTELEFFDTETVPWTPVTLYFEEALILSGSMHELGLQQTFGAGSYACRPRGMVHGPWITVDGCVMLEIQYAGEARSIQD